MFRSSIHFCLLAGACVALSACNGADKNAAVAETEELPRVEVSLAQMREVPQTKEYTANVEAYNVNNISPATANRIKTIAVEVGDAVRPGRHL